MSPKSLRSSIVAIPTIFIMSRLILRRRLLEPGTQLSRRINEVSGATESSGVYIQSLQAAIKKARHARALK